MQKNVGGLDRVTRLVIGPIAVVAGIAALAGAINFGTGTVWTLAVPVGMLLIGVVFVVTGYTQRCALNRLFGLDTYRGAGREDADEPDDRPPSTE